MDGDKIEKKDNLAEKVNICKNQKSNKQSEIKKVLFYTRFENDTAGDEKFLEIIYDAVVMNIDKHAAIEIGLYLAYDAESKSRADEAGIKWSGKMRAKGINVDNLRIWKHQPKRSTPLLSQCMSKDPKPNGNEPLVNKEDEKKTNSNQLNKNLNKESKNDKNLFDFITKPSLNLFVIAGWAHLLNSDSAKYIKNQLKVDVKTRILLCAAPGGDLDKQHFNTCLSDYEYKHVYCLQLGLDAKAGLPKTLSFTANELEGDMETRKKWLSHVHKLQLNTRLKGSNPNEKDELIVIYCSKDKPTEVAENFLKKCKNSTDKDCPVILLGTNDNNQELWKEACKKEDLTAHFSPRTSTSKVLMCGLKDAKYSMVTGALTILEAKYLGLDDCAYLAPPHLTKFAEYIEKAKPEQFIRAFNKWPNALKELSCLLDENFEGEILSKSTALEEVRNKESLKTSKPNNEEKEQSISGNASTFFNHANKLDSSDEEKNFPPNCRPSAPGIAH
ncbi:MAG: hypothetical protein H0U73_12315 [Tatlockia sp.]|nr:hypothetical protein [Tatlockia sp.]